ncbi:magnesium transporter NIPA-domain-containing protein [Absidia repens]|uniref:Magnesium transporter NIPA-domain-containing protein n=1 Tax=Absidia repens TaxID=90262 RepID=A0A1X2ILV9_9FUNG|nr:magnesium transporter NIPA-domain-containing protein [Absidia repens]
MSNSTSFVGHPGDDQQAALFKGIGVSLAIGSGLLIGSSFVFKKRGLLQSTEKAGGVAGEGYHYLRSVMWWSGMILMILGELCNFVAYAFAPAVLVTPLGALSCHFIIHLLKEKLSFHGKLGCLQCIVGAVMIVLHAPTNASADSSVEGFKHLVINTGFLVYAGIIAIISLILIFYCGPRWGKQNMLVYISICSVIGSISVVFTQGFGSAIVYSIGVKNQFTNWFIYIMLLILVFTLVLEIVYLNKALNLFNTALVTPTYYVIFTTMTIISSTILFQGFNASGTDIASCVMGFLCICSGVALLHHSSAAPTSNDNDNDNIATCNNGGGNEEKGNVTTVFSDSANASGSNIQQQQGKSGSLLSFFERDTMIGLNDPHYLHHQSCHRLGEDTPGPAEFFSAPFSGMRRIACQYQQYKTQGNVLDEKHCVLRKEVKTPLLSTATSIKRTKPSSTNSPEENVTAATSPQVTNSSTTNLFQQTSRRDQDGLGPVQVLRIGMKNNNKNQNRDSDDEWKDLVNH